MDENKKIIRTGLIVLFVLIVAFAAYYFFTAGNEKTGAAPGSTLPTQKLPEEAVGKEPKDVAALSVELERSDGPVRDLMAELSSNPTFAQWIKSKDLIRKFAAAVDNIANGQSPRPQADFFIPAGKFKTVLKNGQTYLDPSSYSRYNVAADVFDSLSTSGCARLYASSRGLLRQAYRELGYPKEDFHQTLLRAIVEILKTPLVEEPIPLEMKVASYAIQDPKLEELSPAQKHLLRMGPENLQLIQAKLREVAVAIGFSEYQLPKQTVYTPEIGKEKED